jgi:hypothetical protein
MFSMRQGSSVEDFAAAWSSPTVTVTWRPTLTETPTSSGWPVRILLYLTLTEERIVQMVGLRDCLELLLSTRRRVGHRKGAESV